MNKVYVVLREEDWFYDDKYSFVDVFDSMDSAKTYLNEYLEVMLNDLEQDYGEDFNDNIEIDRYDESDSNYAVTVHMEDSYYIRLSIEEHDIMSM